MPDEFTICSYPPEHELALDDIDVRPYFIGHSADELSFILPTEQAPQANKMDNGWRCMMIEGPLHFDEIGIISAISTLLANQQTPIFVLSTFDTDYFLVKVETLKDTIETLEGAGHSITRV